MSRTNIEIDDELIERAMERYGFRTKRETVDYALRKIVRKRLTPEEFLSFAGIGWEGDLDELRRGDRVPEL
jgi:Arc/MetJ family transcription regulator